ncbi:hypothetical protein LPJ61_002988, partial [Coemansia biformis]
MWLQRSLFSRRRGSATATDEKALEPAVAAAAPERPEELPPEAGPDPGLPESESEPEPEPEGIGPEPTDEDVANVAGLLGRLSIAEVRRYEKTLQSHIEAMRHRMRKVAGRHYPELIDAADVAVAMRASAAAVGTQLERLRTMLQDTRPGDTGAARGAAGNATAEHDDVPTRVYAVAAQVKVLVDTPELIWKALAAQHYLRAALLFLIAREIHDRLCEQSRAIADGADLGGTAVDPLIAFPVVARQWASVVPFREQIATKAQQLLSAADDVPAEASASAICAVALLEDADADVACTLFLSCRGQTLQPLLDRMGAAHTAPDGASQLAANLQELLGRVRQILADYVAIFGTPGGGGGGGGRRYASRVLTTLASICADVDLPTAPPPPDVPGDDGGGGPRAAPRHYSQLSAARARRRKSSVAGRVLSTTLSVSPLADSFALDSMRSPQTASDPSLGHSHGTTASSLDGARRPLHESAQAGSGAFMVARYLPREIA